MCVFRKLRANSRSTMNLNLFIPDAYFLYLLKTSENDKVFLCFQGVERMGALRTNRYGKMFHDFNASTKLYHRRSK